MMQPSRFADADHAWYALAQAVYAEGRVVGPRGLATRELEGVSLAFDMRYPVVKSPARKLSYKFMAAEAYWILTGDNRVDTIAPYNKNIAAFSDDGVTYFGAYGPKVITQLGHVVQALVKDPATRQAVLTIWRENPPSSKDIPCTISLAFHLRCAPSGQLFINTHVFMRSSDIWLGTPYDWFNFTMITAVVRDRIYRVNPTTIELGTQFWTTASAHLYEKNIPGIERVLSAPASTPDPEAAIGPDFPESAILETLDAERKLALLTRWGRRLWG